MKRTILLVFIFATFTSAKEKSDYPLTLEITSYKSVRDGTYTAPRSYFPIGDMVLSTGGMTVPVSTMISEGTVVLAGEKIHCTLWNKKHYLSIDKFHARQISNDELEVRVKTKNKIEYWKFKIIRASKD